jgi:hypothetical protein
LPGHIFDANTPRNLILTATIELLPHICPGDLLVAQTVHGELQRGATRFPRANASALGDPLWAGFVHRFQDMEATLQGTGMQVRSVSTHENHRDMHAFLACLIDEEVMEAGEAEGLALAAFKGFTLYSDEMKVRDVVQDLNAGQLECPYSGDVRPPFLPLEVHTTAWLLQQAVKQGLVEISDAEEVWSQMQIVARLPNLSLARVWEEGRYW